MIPALIAAGATLAGALVNRREARHQSNVQQDMARQGIQMRVADAKKAGIHPLFALGANTPTYSPVSSGVGDIIARGGQDISRAVQATQTEDQRQLGQLQLRNAKLQGDFIEEQIAASQAARAATNPSPPGTTPGAVAYPVTEPSIESRVLPRDQVLPKPREIVSESSLLPGTTAGVGPMYDLVRDRHGNEYFVLNSQVAESLDDNPWLKNYYTAKANYPWIQDVENTLQRIGRPEWVKKLEAQRGVPMHPVRKGGILYWRFADGR